MNTTLPIIGISMGDPAGIGPELCLRILADPDVLALCHPVVYGSAAVLVRAAAQLRWPLPPVRTLWEGDVRSGLPACPAIVDEPADAAAVAPGVCAAAGGRLAFACIERAIRAAAAGQVAAVATGPISKESLHLAGVAYAGHTEIFSDKTGPRRYCMM